MTTEDTYTVWAKDAEVLAHLGRHLYEQPTRLEVRLPKTMAAEAVAAWHRNGDGGALPAETPEQRATRHKAATLGLIGLSIETDGVEHGDEVVVEIESWFIGLALEAADEAGLIVGHRSAQAGG